jgi:uncharacterized protein YcbK (DUF882 family)
MRLGTFFWLSEFHCRDGRRVPSSAHAGLRRLVTQILDPMRRRFGPARVNSGYRHSAYNRRIGGERRSFHIYDERPSYPAADLTFRLGTPYTWAVYARQLMRRGTGGVGQYNRSRFVHVDQRPYVSSWRF